MKRQPQARTRSGRTARCTNPLFVDVPIGRQVATTHQAGVVVFLDDRQLGAIRAATEHEGWVEPRLAQGALAAHYEKQHLFDVEVAGDRAYRESDAYARGAREVVADTPVGKLGLTICYDLRFPQLFHQLRHAGAELLAVPAAFTHTTGEAHWEVLLRARAIETQCFVLAPAQGGSHDDGRETWGHAMAIDPWGRVIAEMPEGLETTEQRPRRM